MLPPISFYIPARYLPAEIPADVESNWPGFGLGIHAWTLQTYLRLKADGFPCQLVTEMPSEGIVLAHRNTLHQYKYRFRPGKNLLLICIKADGDPYPYAQLHVVQNLQEMLTVPNSYYIPHWTQPGLIPRDRHRGDRFENIGFFGHQNNLAPELLDPTWERQLKELGLNWRPAINCNHWSDYRGITVPWNDYSQIDAVVAVRSFGTENYYLYKPATKLYNCWLAGVPAILGWESAFRAEGWSDRDYLEVTSPSELIAALKRLKADRELRHRLVQNGCAQTHRIRTDAIASEWRKFLTTIAVPAWENWRVQSFWEQQKKLTADFLSFAIDKGRSKLKIPSLAGNP